MTIKYPAGVKTPTAPLKAKKPVKAKKHILSAANRGMVLENELNDSLKKFCSFRESQEQIVKFDVPADQRSVLQGKSGGILIVSHHITSIQTEPRLRRDNPDMIRFDFILISLVYISITLKRSQNRDF